MSTDSFETHVTALAVRRLEAAKKLPAQNSKYWSEIASQLYNFDRGKFSQLKPRGTNKSTSRYFWRFVTFYVFILTYTRSSILVRQDGSLFQQLLSNIFNC